jgi:hypothetical protein
MSARSHGTQETILLMMPQMRLLEFDITPKREKFFESPTSKNV